MWSTTRRIGGLPRILAYADGASRRVCRALSAPKVDLASGNCHGRNGTLRTGGARRVGGGFVASRGERLAATIPRPSILVCAGDACRRADHSSSDDRLGALPREFVANLPRHKKARPPWLIVPLNLRLDPA